MNDKALKALSNSLETSLGLYLDVDPAHTIREIERVILLIQTLYLIGEKKKARHYRRLMREHVKKSDMSQRVKQLRLIDLNQIKFITV